MRRERCESFLLVLLLLLLLSLLLFCLRLKIFAFSIVAQYMCAGGFNKSPLMSATNAKLTEGVLLLGRALGVLTNPKVQRYAGMRWDSEKSVSI